MANDLRGAMIDKMIFARQTLRFTPAPSLFYEKYEAIQTKHCHELAHGRLAALQPEHFESAMDVLSRRTATYDSSSSVKTYPK